MSGPLLVTKFHIPPLRPELVPRPRLVERLNQAMDPGFSPTGGASAGGFARKLTLVSAPAGFGKTTLLCEWLHGRSSAPLLQAAWLSLDPGDNDPARFLAYLIAALQQLEPGLGEGVLGAYRSPQPPPTEALLAALINELARLPAPSVLLLDDYHLIEAQAVHGMIDFFLEHLPSQMHLLIATRADPPLALARLRARGQMTEVRVDDLRFDPAEAVVFFSRAAGLDLASEQISILHARTEGWIAGLQLAALSLESRSERPGAPDISGFVQDFAGDDRYVVDYLLEEVLRGQSEPAQTFLLQTSILSRLGASLCDAVTGQANGRAMLRMLEQANLFVIPMDQKRAWYRYHQLFADLLRRRLEHNRPELVPVLHRRAGEWYERNGWEAEAVEHALAAGDFERAAQLIVRYQWGMVARGERATVLGWLRALPGEMVRAQPRLCLSAAWGLMAAMELDAVEPHLRDAERAVDAFPRADPDPALLGEIATIRATVASLRGDVPGSIEHAQEALELLPEEGLFLRGIVANVLGTGYEASGETAAAGRAFAEAAELCRQAGNPVMALIALCNLGRMQELQGQLRRALVSYRQALETAAEQGETPLPVTGLAHVGLGGLQFEWDNLPGAVRHLQKALRLGRRLGIVEIQVVAHTVLAQVYQAQGETSSAQEAIDEAVRLERAYPVSAGTAARLAAGRARLWIAQGDLASAARWARESGLVRGAGGSSAGEFERITWAWLLFARGDPDRAVELLESLLAEAQVQGRSGSAIEILALLALSRQARGETEAALAALAKSLSLADPEEYIRTFVNKGKPMADLLQRFVISAASSPYASDLLALFDQHAPAGQPLVEPLTDRELQVLRGIAAGLSNREIAAELVITVGTTKWHVNNIFGKLQVKRRTEAVARARQLDLL